MASRHVPGDGRNARGELVFAGECSAQDVWAFHRGAVAYVHPALREGFGLPMLEALRAGTPVIAASGAVPAVLSGMVDAFAPGDVAGLAWFLAFALDGPALRALSDSLRNSRKMRAEENAQKTTVKILFPLVFLILPAMMIVIVGPAMMEIVRAMAQGAR